MNLTDTEKRIVKALQGCIPLDTLHPFEPIARECGVTEDELLDALRKWREDGLVRRYGAILNHRAVGWTANAMSIWAVPDCDKAGEVARELASFPEVSHCYERATAPDWPYNLFAMIHGLDRGMCEEIAREVSRRTGVTDYRLLFSTVEFKKESLRYF